MKNNTKLFYKALLVLLCTLLWVTSCKDDEIIKEIPTVSTLPVKDITSTSAMAGGSIVENGNADITSSGICYSITNTAPTIENEKVESDTKSGDFTVQLANLVSGTKYYLRAYATNSEGTGYGEVTTLDTENLAPTVTNLTVTGVKAVSSELSASYTYTDAENNPESSSIIQWYRADDGNGTNEIKIDLATALKYTLLEGDLNKFIRVGVIAKASVGTGMGTEVKSSFTGPIEAKPNAVPVSSAITINGVAQVDEVLTVMYTYTDAENDVENSSSIKWYRADDETGANEVAIDDATAATYNLTSTEQGKFIRVGITPKAATGTSPGIETKSSFTSSITPEATTVTFTYNGTPVTYGIIKSPVTGRKWMDRNLGAPNTPASSTDYANYGDLFQYGRTADGHQLITRGASNATTTAVNSTTTTLASSSNAGTNQFIIGTSGTNFNWTITVIPQLWKTPDLINNPCPSGWHIPSKAEWTNENIILLPEAFSQLKITMGGQRSGSSASFSGTTVYGQYWTTDEGPVNDRMTTAVFQNTLLGGAPFSVSSRASGSSCRCVKD